MTKNCIRSGKSPNHVYCIHPQNDPFAAETTHLTLIPNERADGHFLFFFFVFSWFLEKWVTLTTRPHVMMRQNQLLRFFIYLFNSIFKARPLYILFYTSQLKPAAAGSRKTSPQSFNHTDEACFWKHSFIFNLHICVLNVRNPGLTRARRQRARPRVSIQHGDVETNPFKPHKHKKKKK